MICAAPSRRFQTVAPVTGSTPREGNQISYRCDVRRVTTINYDRKVIRAALGKLNQQADETSTRIDLCLVTSKVDYAPPFDVNASFAEAFENYTEIAGA